MTLLLVSATKIKRDEYGCPMSWEQGETIAGFNNERSFIAYVQKHTKELKNAAVFTGSASLMSWANQFLCDELKKAGLL